MRRNSKGADFPGQKGCADRRGSGYQQYMNKLLTQKCQQLKAHADTIVHDANTRIDSLQEQIKGPQLLPATTIAY